MESSWRAETSTRTTLRVGLMSTTMDPASSTTSSRMRSNKSGVVSESEIRRFEEELEKPALLKKSSTISRKEFEKLKTIIEKRNRELQEFLLQINKSEAVRA